MSEQDEDERPITVDEAVAIAIRCQQFDQLAEAEALYRRVLEVAPERVDALHYSGVLAHQQGRSADAVERIRRSLAAEPGHADWHSNLGIVLQATGDLDGAVAAYQEAVRLEPRHANAHSNLGVLLRAQRRHEEAEAAYRQAIALDPNHADAYQNLAILLSATGRVPEAVTCYCKALTLRPEYSEARRLLALAYCIIDERPKAIALCEEWVARDPDDAVARHTLAACSGRDVPARAADAYVEQTFDSFSRTFEATLAQLHYQAPALVTAMAEEALGAPCKALDVLDVGCGTGLCGPRLAPYARHLTGVDLSVGMLERAREKQVYDTLSKCELTLYLQDNPGAFDLVVSADTLVYFGALEDVAAAAAAALRPGGLFVFTLEEAVDAQALPTYTLQSHGRYVHRLEYVERVLVDAGLHPDVARAELRLERGLPVQGFVVRATRPAATLEHDSEPSTAVSVIGDDRG